MLQAFPLPEQSRRTYTRYTQDLQDDFVVSERLGFKTTETLAVMKARARAWAAQQGLELDPPILPEIAPYRLYPAGRLVIEQVQSWGESESRPGVTGHVEFIDYPDEGFVVLDLLITLPSSAKQSMDQLLKRNGHRAPR